MFPSPREVDKFLYKMTLVQGELKPFLSPTEVNRVFYNLDVSIYAKPELFPSPTEVDRFLYNLVC